MMSTADPDLSQRLRAAGILPTRERLAVAAALLDRPQHLTAEQALRAARVRDARLSRAAVGAVLQLFVRQGLLKDLPMDGVPTVYDSNTRPHHHLYDLDSGVVADLPSDALTVHGVDGALGELQLAGVDVILRVRRPRAAAA